MIRCLLLISLVFSAQAAALAGEDITAEVARLLRELNAPQLAQRETAEAALLGHGPTILELLPPAQNRLPPEVQQRLGRIRRKLQQAAAEDSTNASLITLRANAMPLSKILLAFQEQSGNRLVLDQPPRIGLPIPDRTLNVDFQAAPFWPAFDRLLDQAGLSLYPYSDQRALTVVAPSEKSKICRFGRASYVGPFRFEPVAVVARRDLRESGSGTLVVTLEVAWEPRLLVIGLMQRMADVQAVDERGAPLPVADPAVQLEVPVNSGMTAVKLELPLQLPPRDVREIAVLNGKLLATISGRIETFRFDRLADAKNMEKRIAGATVTLEEVRKIQAGWEVRMKVRFDDAGDALASHRQWIFSNPAYLTITKDPGGDPIAYDTYETTAQGKNELGIAYRFRTEQPIDAMTFVYQTPGAIVTRPFEYELKDIKLP